MSCPDDNLLAKMQEGTLEDEQLRELHDHFDECRRCAELLMVLGRQLSPVYRTSPAVLSC